MIKVSRSEVIIKPDVRRVLLLPFGPPGEERAKKIVNRCMSLPENKAKNELDKIFNEFENRHRDLTSFFMNRFEQNKKFVSETHELSQTTKLLIGAYFSMEYSVESAALFNPSMVWHPDQSGLKEGSRRFILSLRATGEGHISSITFRSGVIHSPNKIQMEDAGPFVSSPEIVEDKFGYTAHFSQDQPISEKILFPNFPLESNGMEDARFVEFYDENNRKTYYATYTAYDGKNIHTMLLKTDDFISFKIRPLQGDAVQNKGFALFPRKVNGKYVMLSRQDNENNFMMYSDSLQAWESEELLMEPFYPWEFYQLGNCGAPIETEAGWLVLAHAVGPMRKYVLSAFLLDLKDPCRVIGRLKEPLLQSEHEEREGYVPNVVYSCGSKIHNNTLVIPYAMSDMYSKFAFVDIHDLLSHLTS